MAAATSHAVKKKRVLRAGVVLGAAAVGVGALFLFSSTAHAEPVKKKKPKEAPDESEEKTTAGGQAAPVAPVTAPPKAPAKPTVAPVSTQIVDEEHEDPAPEDVQAEEADRREAPFDTPDVDDEEDEDTAPPIVSEGAPAPPRILEVSDSEDDDAQPAAPSFTQAIHITSQSPPSAKPASLAVEEVLPVDEIAEQPEKESSLAEAPAAAPEVPDDVVEQVEPAPPPDVEVIKEGDPVSVEADDGTAVTLQIDDDGEEEPSHEPSGEPDEVKPTLAPNVEEIEEAPIAVETEDGDKHTVQVEGEPADPKPVKLPTTPLPTAPPDTQMVVADMLLEEKTPNWKRPSESLKRWQAKRGLTADGLFGTGSALKMAEEIGTIPLIRYWPRGSYPEGHWIKDYRIELRKLAMTAEEPRASQLVESANREQGQGYGTSTAAVGV